MKFSFFALSVLAAGQATLGQVAPEADITGAGVRTSALGEWIIIAVAVILGVKGVLDFYKEHIRAKDPEPPLHKEFASITAMQELTNHLNKFIAATDAWRAEETKLGKASREKMYELIRAQERELPALKVKVENLTELLRETRAGLDLNNHRR